MILVDSLLYKIDQKLNKLSSNDHQGIQIEDKILALNEAQIKLVKQKFTGTVTNTGIGLDGTRKRYEDLQCLVEDYSGHGLSLELRDKNIYQYTAKLADLNPKYMFYVDSYLLANKGQCKDRKIWINSDLAKHANIAILLNNVHYRPSFEYQETFNIISSDEISVFTDGTFDPTILYVSYLRYPLYIDKEGYVKFDGTASVNQDCELEYYLEDELADLTVQNLAMYTENASAANSAAARISTDE